MRVRYLVDRYRRLTFNEFPEGPERTVAENAKNRGSEKKDAVVQPTAAAHASGAGAGATGSAPGNGEKSENSRAFSFFAPFIPFIPIVIGAALRFSIFGEQHVDPVERNGYLIKEYLRPLWLELLVAAYMLPVAAVLTRIQWPKRTLGAIYVIPAAVFLACLVLVNGLKNVGITGNVVQIWVPDVLAAVCTLALGIILVKSGIGTS